MLLTADKQADTDQVWRRFRGDLFEFIRRRVRDDAVAEDVLQDAFERIHRGIDELSDERRVAAWVHAIVRNLITDHYRKERPTEELDERAEEAREDNRDNRLIGTCLLSMIEELPETYGVPVRMVEVEGLSQVELAARLGLSPSGAKSRVQRGREMLRRALARCCRVEFDRRGNVVDYESKRECGSC